MHNATISTVASNMVELEPVDNETAVSLLYKL